MQWELFDKIDNVRKKSTTLIYNNGETTSVTDGNTPSFKDT